MTECQYSHKALLERILMHSNIGKPFMVHYIYHYLFWDDCFACPKIYIYIYIYISWSIIFIITSLLLILSVSFQSNLVNFGYSISFCSSGPLGQFRSSLVHIVHFGPLSLFWSIQSIWLRYVAPQSMIFLKYTKIW